MNAKLLKMLIKEKLHTSMIYASSHVEKKCRICCYKQGSNCNTWVFLGTSEANLLNKDDFMHTRLTADTECHSALLYSFTERKENYGV